MYGLKEERQRFFVSILRLYIIENSLRVQNGTAKNNFLVDFRPFVWKYNVVSPDFYITLLAPPQ